MISFFANGILLNFTSLKLSFMFLTNTISPSLSLWVCNSIYSLCVHLHDISMPMKVTGTNSGFWPSCVHGEYFA